jgi:hypothetical protein
MPHIYTPTAKSPEERERQVASRCGVEDELMQQCQYKTQAGLHI